MSAALMIPTGSSPLWNRTGLAASLLLGTHFLLLALSIPWNSVTIDETMHLPAGISYWDHGRFWMYHHNPPLIKLLVALPAVLTDVPADYQHYFPLDHSRALDFVIARDFMKANRDGYMAVYGRCRLVVAALSVLGGYLVFRWSRELYGDGGGLLSLALWSFSPQILAHSGLVTPDVGATVLGLAATYAFWRYLKTPTLGGVVVAGLLLGATESAKFSFVYLPFIWAVLVPIKMWHDRRVRDDAHQVGFLHGRQALAHAMVLFSVSLLTLNATYLFEGTGQSLGKFDFRSRLLTRAVPTPGFTGLATPRENRFRDTIFAGIPAPFPKHYLLGIDDQAWDIDVRPSPKYLRGELRSGFEPGWWYYYLYGISVKSPLGTLAILLLSLATLFARRCRKDVLTEMTLALPILIFVGSISAQTEMNKHVRYVLPVLPFAFVQAGRLMLAGGRRWAMILTVIVAANAVSVLRVHPHYLAYFNEAAGGPRNGWRHLAGSNLDWGQGLISLKDWLDAHAPDRRLHLAYQGYMDPRLLGINYTLPPATPAPGLHAIGANFLAGVAWQDGSFPQEQGLIGPGQLTYFREFEPVATPGYSIYVYDLSRQDVNRVRRKMGLPLIE